MEALRKMSLEPARRSGGCARIAAALRVGAMALAVKMDSLHDAITPFGGDERPHESELVV
jgi:hypothetical protein